MFDCDESLSRNYLVDRRFHTPLSQGNDHRFTDKSLAYNLMPLSFLCTRVYWLHVLPAANALMTGNCCLFVLFIVRRMGLASAVKIAGGRKDPFLRVRHFFMQIIFVFQR